MSGWQEEIKGVIVAVGGGATVNASNITIVKEQVVHQTVNLELHIHVDGNEAPQGLIEKVTAAVRQALGAINGKPDSNMPIVQRRDQGRSMVDR